MEEGLGVTQEGSQGQSFSPNFWNTLSISPSRFSGSFMMDYMYVKSQVIQAQLERKTTLLCYEKAKLYGTLKDYSKTLGS